MDPIHPGAEFVLPVAQGRLPPSSYVRSAPHARTITSSSTHHHHHLPYIREHNKHHQLMCSPPTAHLCTATTITTAHSQGMQPPIVSQQQYLVSAANSEFAGSPGRNMSPHRGLPASVCVPCSSFNIQSSLINNPSLISSSESVVGQIPPPLMFQRPGELYVPHLQASSSIAPLQCIPHSCAYQDLKLQVSQGSGSSCRLCAHCPDRPVLMHQNIRRTVSPCVNQMNETLEQNRGIRQTSSASDIKLENCRVQDQIICRAIETNNVSLDSSNEIFQGGEYQGVLNLDQQNTIKEPILEDESLTESQV